MSVPTQSGLVLVDNNGGHPACTIPGTSAVVCYSTLSMHGLLRIFILVHITLAAFRYKNSFKITMNACSLSILQTPDTILHDNHCTLRLKVL